MTASPAIALYMVELLNKAGLDLVKDPSFNPRRRVLPRVRELIETNDIDGLKKLPGYLMRRPRSAVGAPLFLTARTSLKKAGTMRDPDVLIIGGGSAGLAAAISLKFEFQYNISYNYGNSNNTGARVKQKILTGVLLFVLVLGAQGQMKLAGLIKGKAELDAEKIADNATYVQGMNVTSVETEGEVLFITVEATVVDYYSTMDFGFKGEVVFFKRGTETYGVSKEDLSTEEDRDDSGRTITTKSRYVMREDLTGVSGPITYDIAAIRTNVNTSGGIYHFLITYDTISVNKKGKRVSIKGFDKKAPVKVKKSKAVIKPKKALPDFMYTLYGKVESIEQKLRGKKEQIKRRLNILMSSVVNRMVFGGEDADDAIKNELQGIFDIIEAEDPGSLEKLFSRDWDLTTKTDYTVKNAVYKVVDTFAAKGGLGVLDKAVGSVISKDGYSQGLIKEWMMEKDEIEYGQMRSLVESLDITETEALAFLEIVGNKKKGLSDRLIDSVPIVNKVYAKGTTYVKKAARLFGWFEDKQERNDAEFARWAGKSYKVMVKKVAQAILTGKTREEALEEARREFNSNEDINQKEKFVNSKSKTADGAFSNMVTLMEKNNVFEKIETIR